MPSTRRCWASALFVLSSLSSLAGCKRAAEPAPTFEAASIEQTRALGARVVDILATGCTPDRLVAVFDIEALGATIAHGVGEPESKAMVKSGLRAMLPQQVEALCQMMTPSGHAGLVRVREGDPPRALVRIYGEQGLAYIELPAIVREGRVASSDLYAASTGELLSESVVRMSAMKIGRVGASDAARFAGIIQRVKVALAAGRPAAAQAAFERLPEKLRQTKPLMLLELSIAMQMGDARYLEVVDAYAKRYAGDPSAALISLDALYMRRQFDEALAAIEQLDAGVDDPFLDALRANIAVQKGDLEQAVALYEKVIEAVPTIDVSYWGLAGAAAARGDHARVSAVFATIEERFGAPDPALVRASPEYAGYVASPEGRAYFAAAGAGEAPAEPGTP